ALNLTIVSAMKFSSENSLLRGQQPTGCGGVSGSSRRDIPLHPFKGGNRPFHRPWRLCRDMGEPVRNCAPSRWRHCPYHSAYDRLKASVGENHGNVKREKGA